MSRQRTCGFANKFTGSHARLIGGADCRHREAVLSQAYTHKLLLQPPAHATMPRARPAPGLAETVGAVAAAGGGCPRRAAAPTAHRPREFTYPPDPHSELERAEGRFRETLGAEGRFCER
jgi:hypothetical protein